MAKLPGGPELRQNNVDPDAEYRALLGVFKGGWITLPLAEQLLGARMKHVSHAPPEVMEAARRAWQKYGKRFLAERKRRNEERPRIECKCETRPCGCYMAEWKRPCELGHFGEGCWALREFGPPRGIRGYEPEDDDDAA
jgi:hypothetical protein